MASRTQERGAWHEGCCRSVQCPVRGSGRACESLLSSHTCTSTHGAEEEPEQRTWIGDGRPTPQRKRDDDIPRIFCVTRKNISATDRPSDLPPSQGLRLMTDGGCFLRSFPIRRIKRSRAIASSFNGASPSPRTHVHVRPASLDGDSSSTVVPHAPLRGELKAQCMANAQTGPSLCCFETRK